MGKYRNGEKSPLETIDCDYYWNFQTIFLNIPPQFINTFRFWVLRSFVVTKVTKPKVEYNNAVAWKRVCYVGKYSCKRTHVRKQVKLQFSLYSRIAYVNMEDSDQADRNLFW